MILLIDNYDSFTYNLYQQIGEVLLKNNMFRISKESDVSRILKVFKNDEIEIKEIKKLNPSHIIISPGPGRPEDAGISETVIREFYRVMPILGVCLGHQAIGRVFGEKIVQAPEILHGKTSQIHHKNSSIFENLPTPFEVARYHSLVIDRVPENFELLAWQEPDDLMNKIHDESNNSHKDEKNKIIMSIKHNNFPLYGIQFHPESFMTKKGEILIDKFLKQKLS